MSISSTNDIPNAEPKLAADAALELLKQLITLSSGALALSATFVGAFRSSPLAVFLLPACWVALIAAVVTALQGISAIVKSRLNPEHDWSQGYGKRMASISRHSFAIGLALLAALGLAVLIEQPRQTLGRPVTLPPDRGAVAPGSEPHYGAIVDAGSSSTRFILYKWHSTSVVSVSHIAFEKCNPDCPVTDFLASQKIDDPPCKSLRMIAENTFRKAQTHVAQGSLPQDIPLWVRATGGARAAERNKPGDGRERGCPAGC